MAEKEMTAKEFLKQYNRMCNNTSCTNCPLVYDNNNHQCGCQIMLRSYPEEVLQIVQKWVEENPEKPKKTRLTEILKLFPKIKLDDYGYPTGCINIYQSDVCKHCIGKSCKECVASFWNEEVKD